MIDLIQPMYPKDPDHYDSLKVTARFSRGFQPLKVITKVVRLSTEGARTDVIVLSKIVKVLESALNSSEMYALSEVSVPSKPTVHDPDRLWEMFLVGTSYLGRIMLASLEVIYYDEQGGSWVAELRDSK